MADSLNQSKDARSFSVTRSSFGRGRSRSRDRYRDRRRRSRSDDRKRSREKPEDKFKGSLSEGMKIEKESSDEELDIDFEEEEDEDAQIEKRRKQREALLQKLKPKEADKPIFDDNEDSRMSADSRSKFGEDSERNQSDRDVNSSDDERSRDSYRDNKSRDKDGYHSDRGERSRDKDRYHSDFDERSRDKDRYHSDRDERSRDRDHYRSDNSYSSSSSSVSDSDSDDLVDQAEADLKDANDDFEESMNKKRWSIDGKNDDVKSYRIKILPCELVHFFDIKKEYMLKLRDYKILIIDPKSSKVVYTLLFKHIKRYDVSQKRGGFRLNTGRKCFIGEGILDFSVKPLEKVGKIKDTIYGWTGLKVKDTKLQEVIEAHVDKVMEAHVDKVMEAHVDELYDDINETHINPMYEPPPDYD